LLNMFRATMCSSSGADDCVHGWVRFTNPSMDALPTNRTWPPFCSHGTYQHKTITSRSRQLLMMGTWLPETCWATIRREIKEYKKWHLVGFSYPHWITMHGQPHIILMSLYSVQRATTWYLCFVCLLAIVLLVKNKTRRWQQRLAPLSLLCGLWVASSDTAGRTIWQNGKWCSAAMRTA
jgi:hypothetical protein